ncbi:hypothetical protein [Halorarum salinum]|uniref:Uncharacterized protein n=1 Tax=Halorarum salinum TaxID=2743089 RepID=A0A7D5QI03_9EURY|nr:hypothetical protein [Halobaculum salinum]QLG63323.1 hypothetical protein HUG12_16930 [Halobaculum salinum]
MELDITGEGGYSDLTMGLDATTTLAIIPTETQVRVSLTSRAGHGEMGLGVGLTAEEARDVGEQLLAHATLLNEND